MKNIDKQTRRDFFKNTFEKALPLLGVIAFASLSKPSFARQNVLIGCDGCNNSCKGTCTGKCEGGCAENGCKGNCSGTCANTCAHTCKEMCAVGCTVSSK